MAVVVFWEASKLPCVAFTSMRDRLGTKQQSLVYAI